MATFKLKQFAEKAENNGVFGSYENGSPKTTSDPTEIQSLPAWEYGWAPATKNGDELPRLEEMQGVQKVLCQAIIENFIEGVPSWEPNNSYTYNSIVHSTSDSNKFAFFRNRTGKSTNQNPWVDTTNWENLKNNSIEQSKWYNGLIGDIKPSIHSREQYGWLVCNGQTVKKEDYPELYAIIGNNFNLIPNQDIGDEFTLPDYRGLFLKGLATSEDMNVPGSKSAETVYDVQEEKTRLPAHSHYCISTSPAQTKTSSENTFCVNQSDGNSGNYDYVMWYTDGSNPNVNKPSAGKTSFAYIESSLDKYEGFVTPRNRAVYYMIKASYER